MSNPRSNILGRLHSGKRSFFQRRNQPGYRWRTGTDRAASINFAEKWSRSAPKSM